MIRRVIITLGFLLSIVGAAMAAEGPGGSYVKPAEAYGLFPALTPIMQLAGTTDSNGNLNITNTSLGTGATPLTAIGNLPGRTDSNGNLYVNCSGCGPATTANLQIASLGVGVAASATSGTIKVLGGGIIFPSADSTTAICLDKADAATAVACLDTTNRAIALGSTSTTVPSLYGANAAYGISLGSNTGGGGLIVIQNSVAKTYWQGSIFQQSSDVISCFENTTSATAGSCDVGFTRSAAGLLALMDGATGTNYRDLITRSLATGTATYASAPIGTVASGTGITVNVTGDVRDVVDKVTLTNAAFSAAALTADATIYTLAAKQKLVDIYADVTQVFTGGAVSAATMTCGIAAGGNTILVSFDVKTATIQRGLADADLGTALTRSTAIQGGYMPSWSATTTVTCRLTTVTANTNALTQGSITFYLTTRAF